MWIQSYELRFSCATNAACSMTDHHTRPLLLTYTHVISPLWDISGTELFDMPKGPFGALCMMWAAYGMCTVECTIKRCLWNTTYLCDASHMIKAHDRVDPQDWGWRLRFSSSIWTYTWKQNWTLSLSLLIVVNRNFAISAGCHIAFYTVTWNHDN